MITGGARLGLYRKGEDSMQGRYHYYRLHPFSMAESTTTLKKSGLNCDPKRVFDKVLFTAGAEIAEK